MSSETVCSTFLIIAIMRIRRLEAKNTSVPTICATLVEMKLLHKKILTI